MAKKSDAKAEARPPLSRDRVLRAAVALADEGGIDALSMRRLARELGVEAMSLYNHVANKDEILDGIVEVVAGEIDVTFDEDWKTALRRVVISANEVLVRHPWAHSLWTARGRPGPARLGYAESLLRPLREAGFSKDLTYHAFHILESYIVGFTAQQLNFPHTGDELAGMAATFLDQLPADEYPYLAEHVRQHMEPHSGDVRGFELGLDLILEGLEKARHMPGVFARQRP